MEYTYEKRLGVVNTDLTPPVVEAGGKAWWTRGGIIVLHPDQWESDSNLPFERVPDDAVTINMDDRSGDIAIEREEKYEWEEEVGTDVVP